MAVNLIVRVLRAEQSSDLSEKGTDVDFVRAAGLAGIRKRLGSYLPRFLAGGGHDYRESIIEMLATMMSKHFPALTSIERQAAATGATYLYLVPRCLLCHGRGYETRPDTPMLSDVACWKCKGSARNEIDCGQKLGPAVRWASNELEISAEQFSSAVGRKLGKD